jgi:carbamate kinase
MENGFLEYKKPIAVVALGGNAILMKNQPPTPEVQQSNISVALKNLEKLLSEYDSIALTHGNGPQVGNELLRSIAGQHCYNLPEIDLVDCDANTQGQIGHWIVMELKKNQAFRHKKAVSIITHVYVDKCHFTPDEYTKYVGPWLNPGEVNLEEASRKGIIFKAPDGQTEKIRRVVPSPKPYRIEEIETINMLLNNGTITVCCGGGGVPIYDPAYEGNRDRVDSEALQRFVPCDVVIDKDRASAVLASSLLVLNPDCDVHLIILTDVKGLFKNSKMREEDFIPEMSLKELDDFISRNALDAGTIRPKLESIRMFLKNGGKKAFLAQLDNYNPENPGTIFYGLEQIELFRTA